MKPKKKELHYSFRLYLYADKKRILGKGGALILEAIDTYKSIAGSAEKLDMSYKFVWDYLVRMRRILESPIIVTHRGGSSQRKRGGGGATLTPLARILLRDFRRRESELSSLLKERALNVPRRSKAGTVRIKS